MPLLFVAEPGLVLGAAGFVLMLAGVGIKAWRMSRRP
jgi:hypothetical protein